MKKRFLKLFCLTAATMLMVATPTLAAGGPIVDVTIDLNSDTKEISPYIYGINDGISLKYTNVKSVRLGGNRMTAYNWENNLSNAGSDWYNSTDTYMTNDVRDEYKHMPGAAALDVIADAKEHNIPYSLLTLQMAGYVADGVSKRLSDSDTAPNTEHWAEVKNTKGSDYVMTPDKNDHVIYNDEYLNYLINTIGNSENGGFKGYALDNEPALWSGTHKLIQTSALSCSTLVEKSVDLAKVVKNMDSKAEVFGPSLYGYNAYDNFQGAPDWNSLKTTNNYRWFIDYYLDEMKKASDEAGTRLLDVLDLHYYTEAKGACGIRTCTHFDDDECIKARVNSVRSLWDADYREDSWIVDCGAKFFPLLPNIQESINQYYPDTKLAFTEYDFGGGRDISGGVTEADFLGLCATHGVYYTTLWSFDNNAFQLAAINMFTNYDRNGTGFGDQLVTGTTCSDDYTVGAYAALTSTEKDGTLRIIMTNKSIHENTTVNLKLNGDIIYESLDKYVLKGKIAGISQDTSMEYVLNDNTISIELDPMSVTELVVHAKEGTVIDNTAASDATTAPSDKPNNLKLIIIISCVAIAIIAAVVVIIVRKKH